LLGHHTGAKVATSYLAGVAVLGFDDSTSEMKPNKDDPFSDQPESRGGAIRELIRWIRSNGKWWLIPILLGLLLVGVLVTLGGSVFAPFLYPLF